MFPYYLIIKYKSNDLVFIKQKVIKIVHSHPFTQENILYLLSLKNKNIRNMRKGAFPTRSGTVGATGRLDRTSGWACRKRVCVKAVMIVKQITGQVIIFFLVPLIILGFVAPSIARLKSNDIQSLIIRFWYRIPIIGWRRYLGAVCGVRINTAFAYSNRLGRFTKDIPPMLFNLEIPASDERYVGIGIGRDAGTFYRMG